MASSHTHRTALETRPSAGRSSPRGRRFQGLLVGVVLAAVTLAARGDEPPAPPAATPALQMQQATPGDAKKIARLEAFAASDTLDLQGRIDKIVTVGLAANEKSAPVRAAARRLLAGIAAETADGALAVISLGHGEVRKPSLKFPDLVSVAMAVEPVGRGEGDADVAAALEALVAHLDDRAAAAKHIYGFCQQTARLAALDGAAGGDPTGASRVLRLLARSKTFTEGAESDARSLGLAEAIVDAADLCRGDPDTFELLIGTVWPKIELLPRLSNDKKVKDIQRLREKIVASVHDQTTGVFPGIESEPWLEWWRGMTEDERRSALLPPATVEDDRRLVILPAVPRGGDATVAPSGTDPTEYRGEERYTGIVSQEPPSVVFLIDGKERGAIGDGSRFGDAFRIAQAKCSEMVMGLPDGTKFTVIVNGVRSDRRAGEMEVFKHALVPANSDSKSEFVRWMNSVRTQDTFEGIDMYQGFAEALELDPDRVVFLTVGMEFDAGRFGASGETQDIEVRHRQGNPHTIDVMRSWDARLLVSALKPRLGKTTVDIGIVAYGTGTVEDALGLLGNVTKYPYRR